VSGRIAIGISSCLLGQAVRYDGGHKRDRYIVQTLGRHFRFVPVCPEVGIGLGVPRPPIKLVGRPGAIRAIGRDDATLDVTANLAGYGRKMGRSLDQLSGYVFKSRSPSCGLSDVPVYAHARTRSGRGIYADAFMAQHPWLPAEDELGLGDPERRDSFLERVFARRRWQELTARPVTAARLENFHAAHKLALMAHSPRAANDLEAIVARAGRGRVSAVIAQDYLARFMTALARRATPARHKQVLLHLIGHLRHELNRREQAELRQAIRRFRSGEISRSAVLALLRRHFRRYPDPAIACQNYLYPDRREQRLRGL
jgi:uncharacterized protein YbbK (DUF523 family)/uncharacterized protein YbgA (DUF1722 family)